MARICEVTGKKNMVGNNVSHAMNKTKRKFKVNIMTKKFFVAEENRWVTLKVSAAGVKNITKLGISAILKDIKYKK
jgi:large subunit ribosomal protein L28